MKSKFGALIGNLSKKEKGLALIIIILIAVFGIYSFIIEPLTRGWESLDKELNAARLELKRAVEILRNREGIYEKYTTYSKRFRLSSADEEILTLMFDQIESIACLLYTSPSPRDRTRSRMPSSA